MIYSADALVVAFRDRVVIGQLQPQPCRPRRQILGLTSKYCNPDDGPFTPLKELCLDMLYENGSLLSLNECSFCISLTLGIFEDKVL